MFRHVVQTISGETTKRNEEERSVSIPHCHREAGFKRLVQENPNEKEHHKHNRENMKKNSPLKDRCPEKNLTNHSARKTVVKKLKSSGIPKCEI